MPTLNNKSKFKSLPSVILIDLDNTLYAYEPCHKAALEEVCSRVITRFQINKKQFTDAYNVARAEVKSQLGKNPSSRNRILYFQSLFENLGIGSPALQALECEQIYWRVFLQKAELFGGAKEFLENVRMLNIPLVLITNLTAQIQFKKLIYFGIEDLFSYVVTSEGVGVEKPEPSIFEYSIRHHAHLQGDVWMIGDDIKADMEGAKNSIDAATIFKIEGVNAKNADLPIVDCYFSDFYKLTKFLRSLSQEK